MTAKVIALHPVDLEISIDDCVETMTAAMMAPVFTLAEELKARFYSEGLPKWQTCRIKVEASAALLAALSAENAFELLIEVEQGQ